MRSCAIRTFLASTTPEDKRVRELPEYGRLAGRVGAANLENSLKFKPDLIIDSGGVVAIYVSRADNVQE